MKLQTRHFGEIDIEENKIIHFPEGILAFEEVKKYVIIDNPDPEIPFQWLQSVDKPSLAFVIGNPFLFKKNYEFEIPEKVAKSLDIKNPQDIIIYSIAVIPQDIKEMTINLRGPIIINSKTKKAKQIVLENEEYSVKYRLFDGEEETD